MTIHWKAIEQYFTVVLFVFQFFPVCNFGKFASFGLGSVRGERVNKPRNLIADLKGGCNDWLQGVKGDKCAAFCKRASEYRESGSKMSP